MASLIHKRSLRTLLFFSGLISASTILLTSAIFSYQNRLHHYFDSSLYDLQKICNQLSHELEPFVSSGDIEQINGIITRFGAHNETALHVSLINENNIIISSNSFYDVGQSPWDVFSTYQQPAASTNSFSHSKIFISDDKNHIIYTTTILGRKSPQEIRSSAHAVLFIDFDIKSGRSLILKQVITENGVIWIFAIVTIFLLIGFINKTILTPIENLKSFLHEIPLGFKNKFPSGQYALEIEQLFSSFAEMAEIVRNTLHELDHKRGELQSILDNSPALISVKDTHGKFILANKQFSNLTGPPPDEYLGKTLEEIGLPGQIEEAALNDLKILQNKEPITMRTNLRMRDGQIKPYLSLKFPVLTPDGNVIGVCTISTDISHQIAIEEKLKKSISENAEYYDSMIRAQTQLIKAQISREEAQKDALIERKKWKLLLELHTAARKNSEILAKEYQSEIILLLQQDFPDKQSTFSKISCNYNRLTDEIEDNYSLICQLVLSQFQSKTQSFNTKDIYDELKELFSNRFFISYEDKSCFSITSHREIIFKTLHHLLRNLSHTNNYDAGLKEIFLACETSPDYLLFSLYQAGLYLGKDTDKMSEPDAPSNHALNLTLAKLLCEYVDGNLSISSSPDGSKFLFYIPVAGDIIPKERNGSALNILIAEDNQVNLKVITKMLEKLQANHIAFTNGESLLKHYISSQYSADMLILDISMPGMNGIELIERIRFHEQSLQLAKVPIIVLTANISPETREQAMKAGADCFLTKPITYEMLAKAINEWKI